MKRAIKAIAAMLIFAAFLFCLPACKETGTANPTEKESASMKIMTFNIQHGKNFYSGKIDLRAVAAEIEKCEADVVCLNEVYGKGLSPNFTDQTKTIADILGFHYFFSPAISLTGMGPYGNAFLSRYPILSAKTVKVPTVPRNHPGHFEDRAVFVAVVDVNGQPLTLIGSHFGLQPEEQEMCVKTVCEAVDASSAPIVLMGDFNVTPDDPVLSPIRERLKDTAVYPGADAMTFPSDLPTEKIDYIFYSSDLILEKAEIPADVVSDHRPVVASFRLTE